MRASLLDTALNIGADATPGIPTAVRGTDFIRVKDIATVRRGYLEPPMNLMRFQGRPALGISVASQAGVGGSTTALALARSLGRPDLAAPGILVGSLGTALGTYLGFAMAGWLA